MKKDIPWEKVEDVAVAIVPAEEQPEGNIWEVYLLNLKKEPINDILVSSKGYGNVEGRKVETSIIRQFMGDMEAQSSMLIEPIQEKLFKISNEFFVSFWHKGQLFDKKYIFVTESVQEKHFVKIPVLDKMGVMIR